MKSYEGKILSKIDYEENKIKKLQLKLSDK